MVEKYEELGQLCINKPKDRFVNTHPNGSHGKTLDETLSPMMPFVNHHSHTC